MQQRAALLPPPYAADDTSKSARRAQRYEAEVHSRCDSGYAIVAGDVASAMLPTAMLPTVPAPANDCNSTPVASRLALEAICAVGSLLADEDGPLADDCHRYVAGCHAALNELFGALLVLSREAPGDDARSANGIVSLLIEQTEGWIEAVCGTICATVRHDADDLDRLRIAVLGTADEAAERLPKAFLSNLESDLVEDLDVVGELLETARSVIEDDQAYDRTTWRPSGAYERVTLRP